MNLCCGNPIYEITMGFSLFYKLFFICIFIYCQSENFSSFKGFLDILILFQFGLYKKFRHWFVSVRLCLRYWLTLKTHSLLPYHLSWPRKLRPWDGSERSATVTHTSICSAGPTHHCHPSCAIQREWAPASCTPPAGPQAGICGHRPAGSRPPPRKIMSCYLHSDLWG